MITALDHIAIAVPDLEKAITRFWMTSGCSTTAMRLLRRPKPQPLFQLAPTHIELVHPLNGGGPIASYLEKRGGGLHHLCFRTDDIDGDVARLRDKGYQFTSDAPTPGALVPGSFLSIPRAVTAC